jgi:hypothetical protein
MSRWKAAAAAIVVCLALGLPVAGQEGPPAASAGPTGGVRDGQIVSDMILKAWATGTEADIDAIYDPEALFILDGEPLATGRDELIEGIGYAIDLTNTYRQVGPTIEYRHSVGDLYVGTITEVKGPYHSAGVPIVCYYRVHDGMVTRHVCLDAEHY